MIQGCALAGGVTWLSWLPFVAAVTAVILTAVLTSFRESRRWTKDQRRQSYVSFLGALAGFTINVRHQVVGDEMVKARRELETAFVEIQFFSSTPAREQAIRVYDLLSKYWYGDPNFKADELNEEYNVLKGICRAEIGSVRLSRRVKVRRASRKLVKSNKVIAQLEAEGRFQEEQDEGTPADEADGTRSGN